MKNEHEPNLGRSRNIFSFVFNFGVVLFFFFFFLIRLVMGSRWSRKKTNKQTKKEHSYFRSWSLFLFYCSKF